MHQRSSALIAPLNFLLAILLHIPPPTPVFSSPLFASSFSPPPPPPPPLPPPPPPPPPPPLSPYLSPLTSTFHH